MWEFSLRSNVGEICNFISQVLECLRSRLSGPEPSRREVIHSTRLKKNRLSRRKIRKG